MGGTPKTSSTAEKGGEQDLVGKEPEQRGSTGDTLRRGAAFTGE